jgi:hypothetical protein
MYICAENTINKSTHLRRKHTGHICIDNRLDTAAHMLKNTLNTSVQLRRQHTEHNCTYAQRTHLTHLNICSDSTLNTSAHLLILSLDLSTLCIYLVSRKKFNEGKTSYCMGQCSPCEAVRGSCQWTVLGAHLILLGTYRPNIWWRV